MQGILFIFSLFTANVVMAAPRVFAPLNCKLPSDYSDSDSSSATAGGETTGGETTGGNSNGNSYLRSGNKNAYQSDPSCYNVDVYNDATYCTAGVSAETACSAVQNADAVCPMTGATSLPDSCNNVYSSYVNDNECTLPENTTCRELPTGDWGCAYDTENYSSTPDNGVLSGENSDAGDSNGLEGDGLFDGDDFDDDSRSSATKTSLTLVSVVTVILAMFA